MKKELVDCFRNTIEMSDTGVLAFKTLRAIKSSKVYKEGFVSKIPKRKECSSVMVMAGTTFEIARQYRSDGKIAVLNFANPVNPGGGVEHGAMAQEECLCRSSNLYRCISDNNVFDDYYSYHRKLNNHFYTDRLIYTKAVTVFKDDALIPELLPKNDWFEVDVITCAAPYLGKRKYTNTTALLNLFKKRIQNIFEAARDNKVDILVLGAFGCGAFKNPPKIVAEAFYQVICEQNYLDDFKQIVFAIKPTEKYCPNVYAFLSRFDELGPNANERTTILAEPVDWRFRRTPSLPAEPRLKGNDKFFSWQRNNKYFGKQFSILGDSISTLDGYNPRGYSVFYSGDNCDRSGVVQMSDTWWDKVISFFGGELLVNNSWSGSKVTKQQGSSRLFPSGCSDERTSSLHINEVYPDVIIVYLGTNDWAFGVRKGDDTRILEEDANEFFEDAYNNMLYKLRKNYPQSEIWCCTLCETYIERRPDFNFPHEHAGTHIEEYNNIIRKTVYKNACRLIDLYDFRIPYDSIDGSHPTNRGMDTIATMVIRTIANKQAGRFLDCKDRQHNYVVREQYADKTKYVCTGCAKETYTTKSLFSEEKNMDNKTTAKRGYDRSEYVWGNRNVNRIKWAKVSWGNRPIYNIEFDTENDTIKLYRTINWSRDGWIGFPDGYFDEKIRDLHVKEKIKLFQHLRTIDFNNWKTDDIIISSFEKGVPGFFVEESFHCVFEDGNTFYCAYPPQNQFEELIECFKSFFPDENMEPYSFDEKPADEEITVLLDDSAADASADIVQDNSTEWFTASGMSDDVKTILTDNNVTDNSEYVMIDSNVTTILYSDTLMLTFENTGAVIKLQKNIVEVGRDKACDLQLKDKSAVSRCHATFFYERDTWFLRDNSSTNGTWINGVRIQPGKKYQLAADDEINFANAEKLIFYKSEHCTQQEDPEAIYLRFLEDNMAAFAQSGHKNEALLKPIVASLANVPIYLPVEIDIEAIFGSQDPEKLKPGDVLQPNKDVRMRILTLRARNDNDNDNEWVPLFTSEEEVNKGQSVSVIRFYPRDYLPKLAQMDKNAVVNPFSENRFFLNKETITDVLLPMVQIKTNPHAESEEQPADKFVGQIIGGRYKIIKLLGGGPFFATYLVLNINDNKMWAMKLCDKTSKKYSLFIQEQMLKEEFMISKLQHHAIPQVENIIEDDEKICLVREYIEGETLETIVKQYGAQPADKVVEWGKQLCEVLGYLHGLTPPHILRDVKPANIVLKLDGTLKIIDFDIMRTYKQHQKGDTTILGTKGYAAPEQYGISQSDARTDIFALGMTMHHLVTGVDPRHNIGDAIPVCEINPKIPKGLEYIISKCTQKNPDERYQSCEELTEDLNNYMNLPKPKGVFGKLFGKK